MKARLRERRNTLLWLPGNNAAGDNVGTVSRMVPRGAVGAPRWRSEMGAHHWRPWDLHPRALRSKGRGVDVRWGWGIPKTWINLWT